jgi:hypothetical protein
MLHSLANSGFTNQKYPSVKMTVHMDESIINNIIIKFLQNYGLTVFGYNVSNDIFWGKKFKKHALEFQFVLKVYGKGVNLSHIEIYNVFDNKNKTSIQFLIKKLIREINEV